MNREWKLFMIVGALGFCAVALPAATAAQNLVVNGDFESGNSGFTSKYVYGDVSNPGTYTIGTNPSAATGAWGDWCNCGDHTSGAGNMMIVNGANSDASPVWQETVKVTPSTNYTFSFWGAEVDHESTSLPRLALKINSKAIGGSVFPKDSPDNGGKWENYTFSWNSGTSQSATLTLVDLNTDTVCNDFAIDDISFTPAAASPGSSSSMNPSAPVPIPAHVQIAVEDANGTAIARGPQEKVALMFVNAIASMESNYHLRLQRPCSLSELAAGVKWPGAGVGRLKYDPAMDPN